VERPRTYQLIETTMSHAQPVATRNQVDATLRLRCTRSLVHSSKSDCRFGYLPLGISTLTFVLGPLDIGPFAKNI
jgi:hypothetical protein